MTPRGHAAVLATALGVLAAGFFLLNRDHAYHPTDDGFVLAYAWRVLQGEVPYRDFLYVRTPLSPYLHVPELLAPEGWTIAAGRFTFYLELWAAAALPAAWAALRLGVRATPRAVALCGIFFALALHNFPPMPWPTVDAIALSTGAATAFLFSRSAGGRRALALRGIASLLLGLAVLAKQTFALLALAYVVWALVETLRARSWSRFAASAAPGAFVALATLALLAAAGALGSFAQQVVQPAQLRPTAEVPWSGDLAAGGVEPYLRALSPLAVLFFVAPFLLGWTRDAGAARLRKIAVAAVAASLVAIAVEAQLDVFTGGRHLFLLLGGLALAGAIRWRDTSRGLSLAAFGCLLAIAWSASLSFAYQTPLLGLAAGGVLVEHAWPRWDWPPERLAVALALGLTLAGVARIQLEHPYRDLPREAQVADLGESYPRFGRLLTNAANAERFRELRELSTRHALDRGRSFVVMPDYPLISFLAGARSPLSIDWLQPQEYAGNEDRLAGELATRRPVVLIEREPSLTVGPADAPPAPSGRPPETAVRFVREIAARWTLVAEGRHFCVYYAP